MNNLAALHWREPLWLLLALQPLLIALPAWLRHRHRNPGSEWIDTALQPWVLQPDPHRKRRLPDWRLIAPPLAWLLLAIAAAGPRLPPADARSDGGAGQDLVLLVDASRSMHATDTHPSRLRRARVEIRELLQRVPAARVALLLYAGRPHLLVPPTRDHHALANYLQQLDQITLPTSGSNSTAALQQAIDTALAMQTQRHSANPGPAAAPPASAAVIWLTDGDLPKGTATRLQPLLTRFRQQQLPLSILGLGSSNGTNIPRLGGGWLKQKQQPVITRMDTNTLQQLADSANGRFSPVQDDSSDWRQLYDHNIAARLAPGLNHPGQIQWHELYPWALTPGLILLLLIGANNSGKNHHNALTLPILIPALTLLTTISAPGNTQAAERPTLRQAWQHYQAGDYPTAIHSYASLRGYAARMGEASANYRNGQFDNANSQFSQAILQADTDQQRADALYNLGNSLFRQSRYDEASEAFTDALRYNPQLRDSRFNLDLSQALQAAVSAEQRRQRSSSLAGNTRIGGRIEGRLDPNDNNDFVSSGISTMPKTITALPQSLLSQGTNSALAQQLIARGLARSRHQQPDNNNPQTPEDALRARQNLTKARLRMTELDGRQPQLWKRLFEMEEGFPAPLKEPKHLPGLPPW